MLARTARHRALRDSVQADVFARDAVFAPEERGLLGLPVSIPIVDNLLTDLLGGGPTTTKTTKTTAPPAPPATPTTTPNGSTPTTSVGSGSGGGGGSGSGSGSDPGSGSGSGSDPGSGSNPSSGSDPSSGDSGSGPSGSSSGSSGSSGSSDPNSAGGPSNNSGGSSNNSPGDSSKPSASGSSGPGSEPTGATGGNGSNPSPKGSSSAPGGVLAAAGQTPGANGDDPLPPGPTSVVVTGGKTMTVIGSVTFSTGVPTHAHTGAGGGSTETGLPTGGDNGSGSGGVSTGSGGGKHGLPSYVAAIIGVLGAFAIIILLVFCIRKRAVARRAARRTWWSNVVASGGAGTDTWTDRNSGDATVGNASSARSIRSSFGTTFDHSEFSITFDDNVPALPPMAEIRGGPSIVPKGDSSSAGNVQPLSPITPITPFSPTIPAPLLVSIENSNIYSDASRRVSTGSSASAQYLTIDRDNGATNPQLMTPEVPTPMSVRPFSPTESFTFPSPPREHRSSTWTLAGTTPLPTETTLPQSPAIVLASPPPPPPTIQYSENPFADAFSVSVSAPAPASSGASAEFDAVETIWRPFEQTLQDEMTVRAGDRVKVLAVYDDGWAMIEMVGLGKGKGKAVDGKPSVGLIPIDCMRRAEESVSSFLAAKRVSSVDATGYTAMAI